MAPDPTRCPADAWPVEARCVPLRDALAPSGRLFVVARDHPRASDDNAGTAEAPWRTIGRAAAALQPGDAVVIRAGVYRETVAPPRGGTGPDRRITYAAAPGEPVVVSGADPAPTGWTPDGPDRWQRPWPGPAWPTYSADPVFRRELVVAGGDVLRPVARLASLAPGTMHVGGTDTAPGTLTVWLRPGQRPESLAVGTRARLFWPVGAAPDVACGDASQPSWLRVVGLQFVHAANRAQWGAVCAGASHGLWEDVRVAWTIGQGVDVSGADHVFRRVAADDHGQLGWGGGCTRCLFEDTAARRNNWRGHDPFWEAGGGKWRETTDTVFRRHRAEDNRGPGLWLDIDNARNTIENSTVTGNDVAGILLELRTVETLVQHTVIRGTRWREWSGTGLLTQASSRNLILHNTIEDNDGTGLWLRLDPDRRAPDAGTRVEANWIVGNVRRAPEAREIAVEAETRAGLATHAFAGNVYGRHAGSPVRHSTFFAASSRDREDYRGDDPDAWRLWTGETGARLARRGEAQPDARPGAAFPAVGAAGAPPRRGRRVGAEP